MSSRQPSTLCDVSKGRRTPNRPSDNMGRIYLRHDIKSNDYGKFQTSRVTMFAPNWVEEALKQLSPHLAGISFQIISGHPSNEVLDKLTLKEEISLLDLHKIARNEPVNTSGHIQLANYQPCNLDTSVILTLKDLIRQCIIVGIDTKIGYGGYHTRYVQQKSKVYLCDLAGLQFQLPENSGRLVLIAQDNAPYPQGLLDDFIYQQVVGEKKPTYRAAEKDSSGRYVAIPHIRRHGKVFFDKHAYKRFVTNDVILCGIALNSVATRQALKHQKTSLKAKERGTQDTKHIDQHLETKETVIEEKSLGSLMPQPVVQTSGTEQEKVPNLQKTDADGKQGSAPGAGITPPEQKEHGTEDKVEPMDVSDLSDQMTEVTPGQVKSVEGAPKHKKAGQDYKDVAKSTGPPSEKGSIISDKKPIVTEKVVESSTSDGEYLNFKFLSYGAGFFAGEFGEIIRQNILSAVIDGLEELFQKHQPQHIKAVEFPFYQSTAADVARLEKLKATYGLIYRFSKDDSLKDTIPGLITATTNCADPHVATGNEMGHSSVDAAIASNLVSRGKIFSPLLNPKMKSKYIVIHAMSSL